jgi:hypothetical protein
MRDGSIRPKMSCLALPDCARESHPLDHCRRVQRDEPLIRQARSYGVSAVWSTSAAKLLTTIAPLTR